MFACCVLHNFCQVQEEEFLEGERVVEGERAGEKEGPAHDEEVLSDLKWMEWKHFCLKSV